MTGTSTGEGERFKIGTAVKSKKWSKAAGYRDLVLGKAGLGALARFELITTMVSWLPGAIGLLLRSRLYPKILGRVGRNTIFGTNIVFRHPHKIEIGDNVIIDDNCLLDAKGSSNKGIRIGDNVYIGRNTILSCKDGDITLRDHVNIGFNCEIFSSAGVILEEYALLAAYCYIVGGGSYDLRITGRPIAEQPVFGKNRIVVGKNCWLGAGVTVLEGASIGHDSAVGASALVRGEIPPFSVAAGVPARVLRKRE